MEYNVTRHILAVGIDEKVFRSLPKEKIIIYARAKYNEQQMATPVNDYRFWWDEQNIQHIADHGVDTYEAETIIRYANAYRRAPEGKYVVLGQTDNGRYLMVVFAPKGGNRVRVITARDLTAKEKRSTRKQ